MGIIYVLGNKINGRKYVGQARQTFKKRWEHHLDYKDCHMVITRAIKKYGPDNFNKHLFYVPNEMLDYFEIEMIKKLNTLAPNGYNLDSGGKNKIMHQDTKEKLSKALTGKKLSEETKQKLKEAWNKPGMRERHSEIHKGNIPGNKGIYKYPIIVNCKECGNEFKRNPNQGFNHRRRFCSRECRKIYFQKNNPMANPELRKKLSNSRKKLIESGWTNPIKGKTITPREVIFCKTCGSMIIKRTTTRQQYCNMECSSKKPINQDTRIKMSIAAHNKKVSFETRKKLSDSIKKSWLQRKAVK